MERLERDSLRWTRKRSSSWSSWGILLSVTNSWQVIHATCVVWLIRTNRLTLFIRRNPHLRFLLFGYRDRLAEFIEVVGHYSIPWMSLLKVTKHIVLPVHIITEFAFHWDIGAWFGFWDLGRCTNLEVVSVRAVWGRFSADNAYLHYRGAMMRRICWGCDVSWSETRRWDGRIRCWVFVWCRYSLAVLPFTKHTTRIALFGGGGGRGYDIIDFRDRWIWHLL